MMTMKFKLTLVLLLCVAGINSKNAKNKIKKQRAWQLEVKKIQENAILLPAQETIQANLYRINKAVANIRSTPKEYFDIKESRTPIHNLASWKALATSERRMLAEELFYSFIGLCDTANITDYYPHDIKFISKVLAKGDDDCFFFCGVEKLLYNAEHWPSNRTLNLALDLGDLWVENIKFKEDMEAFANIGRRKAGQDNEDNKMKAIMSTLFITGNEIQNIALMAVIGYQGEELQDGLDKILPNEAGCNRKFKCRKERNCFDANGIVRVMTNAGMIVEKNIKDLRVGDMAESVNEKNGKISFSKVYFIAHDESETIGSLLRIYYKDINASDIKSIGLTGKHLIYSNNGDHLPLTPPLNQPVIASSLQRGDYIWVKFDNLLKPVRVVDIIPYVGHVLNPLTENHHIIVDGVHASVYSKNEIIYRTLTAPLRWGCSFNLEWCKTRFVKNVVDMVRYLKEPFISKEPQGILSYFLNQLS